ncbi:MAG: HAD family hydrolase [Streptococcaceae bacterium]|jgi:Cof subfamily protein (haloacid dehalogenase superfamily)|nr:HAD family hydrolase [Streptococcaceae bacterium]
MVKLILTDLDGTLLNSQGTFNQNRFKILLERLKQKNIAFAAVTGRQMSHAESAFSKEFLKDVWFLGDSASRIKKGDKIYYEKPMTNTAGKKMIQLVEKTALGQTIIACTNTYAYILKNQPVEYKNKVKGAYLDVIEVDDFSSIKEPFVKITIYDAKARALKIVSHLKQAQEEFHVVPINDEWYDITAKGVHKGTAVEKLQELLGVSKEDCMAFGDGYNDVELLTQAKFAYAMDNAVDAVKEIAPLSAPSNDENGVMAVIEQEVLSHFY